MDPSTPNPAQKHRNRPVPSPDVVVEAPVDELAAALDAVRDELLAMDPDVLVPLNVDVVASATTVLGVVQNVRLYRPALVAKCGEEAVRRIDRLELLAHAALQAHADFRGADATVQLGPLSKELTKIRDVLVAEARSLILRGLLDDTRLRELTGTKGHKNLYVDALQLVAVFRTAWADVDGKCGVTSAYLLEAENLAVRLGNAIGENDRPCASAAADLRHRAFSLLSHTYEEARRQITYLRWFEGDYDRIAPSFFSTRAAGGRRRRRSTTEVATDTASENEASTDHATPRESQR